VSEEVKAPDTEQRISRMMNDWQLPLLRTCCLLLGDADQARDAVQETFLKAWQGLPGFRGECSEKTWLTRIAVNVCRDMRRGSWYRLIDRRVDPDRLPEPVCEAWEKDRELLAEVLALPRRQREAILLYYYHGMTVTEVAEALRISQPSVTRRIKSAKAKLKKLLEEDTHERAGDGAPDPTDN